MIAGLAVAGDGLPAHYAPFVRREGLSSPQVAIVQGGPAPTNPVKVLSHDQIHVSRAQGGWLIAAPQGSPALWASGDYGRISVIDRSGDPVKLWHILRTAIECALIKHGALSLHAACVTLDGGAWAFTGRSGRGKSTRAGAWVDALGAQWLSGDRPAIRLSEGGALACGVPWDGKEGIYRAAEAPLTAILEVRRAPFVAIRKLSPRQAWRHYMRQAFVPMWDPTLSAQVMGTARKLADLAPTYRLFCGPDGAAAQAVHRALMEGNVKEAVPEMKLKEGFVLRKIVGEYIAVPVGDNINKFDGAVVLNEVSAFIWENLANPVSREDLLDLVLNEFDVDRDRASHDLDEVLAYLSDQGLLAQEG